MKDKVLIEYRRDVTSPDFLKGAKGDKKPLDHWHAAQIIEEGFARPLVDSETGEPIEYPPDPIPVKTGGRKVVIVTGTPAAPLKETDAVSAQADPAPITETATEGLKDGTAEQAASSSVNDAPSGESTDTRMG